MPLQNTKTTALLSNRPLVTVALGISFAMWLLMICGRRVVVRAGGLTLLFSQSQSSRNCGGSRRLHGATLGPANNRVKFRIKDLHRKPGVTPSIPDRADAILGALVAPATNVIRDSNNPRDTRYVSGRFAIAGSSAGKRGPFSSQSAASNIRP